MDKSIAALDKAKHRTALKERPYYAKRCEKILMYDYSFACEVVRRRKEAVPPYTATEIRHIMWHPMSLCEILKAKEARKKNLFTWLLGKLPSALSVMLIWLFVKLKEFTSHIHKSKNVIDPK